MLSVDFSLCILTVWLAYYLRLEEFISFTRDGFWVEGMMRATVASVILALPIFIMTGLYRAIFRYSGWPALLAVARAIGLYGLFYLVILL